MRAYTHYVIEKPSGDLLWTTATRGALFKKGPRMRHGKLRLFGGDYVVNPKLHRRRVVRRWSWLPWPLEEHVYAFFVQGLPDQMPFFRDFANASALAKNSYYTSEILAMGADSDLGQMFLHPNIPWGIVVGALFGGLGVGVIVMTLLQRVH